MLNFQPVSARQRAPARGRARCPASEPSLAGAAVATGWPFQVTECTPGGAQTVSGPALRGVAGQRQRAAADLRRCGPGSRRCTSAGAGRGATRARIPRPRSSAAMQQQQRRRAAPGDLHLGQAVVGVVQPQVAPAGVPGGLHRPGQHLHGRLAGVAQHGLAVGAGRVVEQRDRAAADVAPGSSARRSSTPGAGRRTCSWPAAAGRRGRPA